MLNYTTFYSNKSLHKQLVSSIKNVLSKTHTLHPYITQKRIYGLEDKAIINSEALKNSLKNNKIEKIAATLAYENIEAIPLELMKLICPNIYPSGICNKQIYIYKKSSDSLGVNLYCQSNIAILIKNNDNLMESKMLNITNNKNLVQINELEYLKKIKILNSINFNEQQKKQTTSMTNTTPWASWNMQIVISTYGELTIEHIRLDCIDKLIQKKANNNLVFCIKTKTPCKNWDHNLKEFHSKRKMLQNKIENHFDKTKKIDFKLVQNNNNIATRTENISKQKRQDKIISYNLSHLHKKSSQEQVKTNKKIKFLKKERWLKRATFIKLYIYIKKIVSRIISRNEKINSIDNKQKNIFLEIKKNKQYSLHIIKKIYINTCNAVKNKLEKKIRKKIIENIYKVKNIITYSSILVFLIFISLKNIISIFSFIIILLLFLAIQARAFFFYSKINHAVIFIFKNSLSKINTLKKIQLEENSHTNKVKLLKKEITKKINVLKKTARHKHI